MTTRVLICGDRRWHDESLIDKCILILKREFGDDIAVIHGACRGADSMAGRVATRHELTTWSEPAKWSLHGKSAGPIRNSLMLTRYRPQLVIAFHTDLSQSRGTKNMVEASRRAGVPTINIKTSKDLELIVNAIPNTRLRPEDSHTRTA